MRYPYLQRYESDNWYFSAMAKALAHPARVAVVRYLYHHGEVDYTVLADSLPLSNATVSQHLKVLREAGFIQGVARGTQTVYRINPRVVRTMAKGIRDITTGKNGPLPMGRAPEMPGAVARTWWEDIPRAILTGPYYAAETSSGIM